MRDSTTLSAIAEINPRTVIPADQAVSFIGMDDVSESFTLKRTHDRNPAEPRQGYTRFREEDLLFAKITPCMENGKGARATGLTNGYGLGSTEFHVLRARIPDSVGFIAQWLSFSRLRLAAEAQMTGSAGQRRVPSDFFRRFRIPEFSLDEQMKIAEILDTLDSQISSVERIIEKLKLAREGMLRDLLSCGVNSDGYLRDPWQGRSEFKETSLGLLPREWSVSSCGSLSRDIVVGIVIRPTQYYRPAGIPVLRSANVRESGLDPKNVVYMSPVDHAVMSKSAVKPGDLVTVRTGYPGTTAVVPESIRSANCVDIIITRPGPQVRSDYLSLWINSDLGKGQVLRAQGGLAQQHFNVSEMKSLLVAVPSLAEQAIIADRAAAADQRIANEVRELAKLTTLKRGLAADLLSGRVRAPSEVAS